MSASSGASPARALAIAVEACRSARIPYAIVGAWALGAWGAPRATLDVDLLVLVRGEGLDLLCRRLEEDGMVVDQAWLHWNPTARQWTRRLRWRKAAVDLLAPRDDHDRALLRRRRRRRVAGRDYWFASPEDFLLQKIKLGRPQDFRDAATVVERCGSGLDRRHLVRWARRLGVTEELDYLLSEAPPPA